MLSLYSFALERLGPDYLVRDAIIEENPQRLTFSVEIERRVITGKKHYESFSFKDSIRPEIATLHPLVFFTLFAAMSVRGLKKKAKALLVMLPVIVVLMSLDVGLTMKGRIEDSYRAITSEAGSASHVYSAETGLWQNMYSRGGRYLLSVFAFSACMAFVYGRNEKRAVSVDRNEPCPCGSGKKYKKCCMNLSK